MHTGNKYSLPEITRRNGLAPRLEWLLAANQRATERQQLFRTAREEREWELMQNPLTAQQAFARFGLLLGALPPAALFGSALHFLWQHNGEDLGWLILLALGINIICAEVGWLTGKRAAPYIHRLRDTNWLTALPAYAVIGFYWAAITGAAGGFLFFGGGVLFGTFFALPVGLIGFALFAPLYRLLERGGMIPARQFWPVAIGITMSLMAFILKLYSVIMAN